MKCLFVLFVVEGLVEIVLVVVCLALTVRSLLSLRLEEVLPTARVLQDGKRSFAILLLR